MFLVVSCGLRENDMSKLRVVLFQFALGITDGVQFYCKVK